MKKIPFLLMGVLFTLSLFFSGFTTSDVLSAEDITCRALCVSDQTSGPDPITINSATLNGDCLDLVVQFSGGCVEHRFCLNWAGVLAESAPPQAFLYLVHDDNNDPCDNIVTRHLYFDVGSTQDPGGHLTILKVNDGSQTYTISYSY